MDCARLTGAFEMGDPFDNIGKFNPQWSRHAAYSIYLTIYLTAMHNTRSHNDRLIRRSDVNRQQPFERNTGAGVCV